MSRERSSRTPSYQRRVPTVAGAFDVLAFIRLAATLLVQPWFPNFKHRTDPGKTATRRDRLRWHDSGMSVPPVRARRLPLAYLSADTFESLTPTRRSRPLADPYSSRGGGIQEQKSPVSQKGGRYGSRSESLPLDSRHQVTSTRLRCHPGSWIRITRQRKRKDGPY